MPDPQPQLLQAEHLQAIEKTDSKTTELMKLLEEPEGESALSQILEGLSALAFQLETIIETQKQTDGRLERIEASLNLSPASKPN